MHPEITIVWADSAYAGKLVTWAHKYLDLTVKAVSRPKNVVGFVVLPRRWVVERSLAWGMHARRHALDSERLIRHSESLITWAAITLMTGRITRRQSRRASQPAPRDRKPHFSPPHRRIEPHGPSATHPYTTETDEEGTAPRPARYFLTSSWVQLLRSSSSNNEPETELTSREVLAQ
ncbi:transposase [Streptomyces sp. NPDC059447]|uniref:transposase n=1 Tax=Streptomyces sp. NPDC059447 TaxID=3346834 RepID=UPI0036B28F3D